MIQDIAPYRYDNAYRSTPPQKDSFLFCYQGKEVLLIERDKRLTFPCFADLEEQNPSIYENCTYLFSINEFCFYMTQDEMDISNLAKTEWKAREFFRTMEPRWLAFAGVTGFQLYGWYRSHQFCGRCGQATQHDAKERMMLCPACGQMEYPKISPAVIVAILDGDRILLSKYAGRAYARYALIAGFTEIGETIEETVRREVLEEVGVKVKNIRFYKSQPWSFSDTLLMGFYVDLDGSDQITLDETELALAEWVYRKDIPPADLDISLTSEMMQRFCNGELC